MDPRERERDPAGPQLAGDLHEDVRAVRVGEEHGLGVDDDAGRLGFAERELVDARAEVVGVGEEQWAVDPQDEDPQMVMAGALATYLSFRRTELDREPAELLRLAARAEFDGKPPEVAAAWLEEQGISW